MAWPPSFDSFGVSQKLNPYTLYSSCMFSVFIKVKACLLYFVLWHCQMNSNEMKYLLIESNCTEARVCRVTRRFIAFMYLLTYLLTPWKSVFLQNLTGSELVKKFPSFYGTRTFITAFTSARHLSLFSLYVQFYKIFLYIFYLNLLPIFPIPKTSLQALWTKTYCAVRVSGHIALNCRMNHTLEGVWKEPVVAVVQGAVPALTWRRWVKKHVKSVIIVSQCMSQLGSS
jgi:hypothetical protein